MDQAAAAKRDELVIRGLGEVLQRNGVIQTEPARSPATDTPSHDKDSYLERARFRDLAQEQGKQPEAILQVETTWRDRVGSGRAEGDGSPEGHAPNSWAARVKASRAEETSNDNGEPSQERHWAKEVERSRSHGTGRDRPAGQQRDRQHERGGHER